MLRGVNALESASRLSDGGVSEKELQVGVKNKSESPTKINTRKKPKFQLKGFALGYNAVLKNSVEAIEERDEEFKATGTQNVANHLAGVNEEGKEEGAAANQEKKGTGKAGGLYVETDYKPKLKSEIQTAGTEPRSGMNRGVVSPSLGGTPGGANGGVTSTIPGSNRNRVVSELTDESEYDSEEEEESEEESGEESSS